MNSLTLVLPHYMNRGMLAEQQKVWSSYPDTLRSRLNVIVVDDCSPKGSRPTYKDIVAEGLGSIRVYRLVEKARWNWLACRNLGAELATTDWLLLTDIDHVVPAETLTRILDNPLILSSAYRFRRVTAIKPWPYTLAECPTYKTHNDTWMLTREMFFHPRVGGYDERLSGLYGTSGEFRDRLLNVASSHVTLPDVIVRYPREIIADASTPPAVYTRKGDPVNDAELTRRKEERSHIPDWVPLRGLIGHEIIV